MGFKKMDVLLGIIIMGLGISMLVAQFFNVSFSIFSAIMACVTGAIAAYLYKIYLKIGVKWILFPVIVVSVIAVTLLLGSLVCYAYLWPLFILAPALGFLVVMSRSGFSENVSLWIPTVIISGIVILFYICILWGWGLMKYLWPTFILLPGLGNWLSGTISGQVRLRKSGYVSIILAAFFYLMMLGIEFGGFFWSATFIVLGLVLILKSVRSRHIEGYDK